MSLTEIPIDIYDPDGYVAGPPHEVFTELRRTHPVYWQDMPDSPGYWAVLRHADVVTVAREPLLFSASTGGVILEDLDDRRLTGMQGMLLAMDPPRHVVFRRPVAPTFKKKVIDQLEGNVRAICREIMARAADKSDVEFVHDVTSGLPSRVVGQIMGLPVEDLEYIHHLAEQLTTSQDSDYVKIDDDPDAASFAMAAYAVAFATRRRAEEPREDLTTLVLQTDFGGAPMTDGEFANFFVQLVTAGNDTTKTMLSSGLAALLAHPGQLAELRADHEAIPGAVEEILRWANPLHYFRRTATDDVELNGAEIKAGDKVAMYYTSANRDEAVFEDSQAFDIHRKPNPHLSFGIAEHFCLGVHLARLEGRVFFEELLSTFPRIEQTGDAVRARSNLNNALKALPVRLGR